jgi:hypothetical protein
VSGTHPALRVLFALLLIAFVGGGDFLFLRNYTTPAPQDVTGAWSMTVTTAGVAVEETLTLQQRRAQLSSALTRTVNGHAVSFPGMGRLSGSAITFDVTTEFTRGGDENDQFTGAVSDATHMAGALTATILPLNGSNPYTVTGTWLAAKIAPRASQGGSRQSVRRQRAEMAGREECQPCATNSSPAPTLRRTLCSPCRGSTGGSMELLLIAWIRKALA